MNTSLSRMKVVVVLLLLVSTAFSCRKKYPYFIPDGTPGPGADSATITIDTSSSTLDASGYADARVFPGLIDASEPRLQGKKVTLDMNYRYVGNTLRISVPPQPRYSVGLYAPPGERIEIDVPEGLYGLNMQIGAWTDNLSGKPNPKRVPVIYNRQHLSPGINYMRNLYGGTIYIIPQRPIPDSVTLTFSGAVKSPDFILGKTDPAEWWQEIQKSSVPWLELRSPYMIVTLPRNKFISKNIQDPGPAIQFWNESIKHDFYEWEGLIENAPDPIDEEPHLPFRAVLDIEISLGYGHNGFPIMAYDDDEWFGGFTDIDALNKADAWGTYHEFGHNNQQGSIWSWSGLGETSNNLFIFKAAHRLSKIQNKPLEDFVKYQHQGLTENFANGVAYTQSSGKHNFTEESDGDPFWKLLPFLQMFHGADMILNKDKWGFMAYLYTRARHAKRLSTNDQDKKDFVYEALCDYTKEDWLIFFQKWGIPVSDYSQNQIALKKYPEINKTYWTWDPATGTGGSDPYVAEDPYDQKYWSIAFSSQENGGEGPVSGYATAAIDGDPNTFWHSHWSAPAATPPHWLDIDMKTALAVKSFSFIQRAGGSRNIKNIDIEVSDNNINWQDLGTFQLQKVHSTQTIVLSSTLSFRYFKLTVQSSNDVYDGTQFAALAEVWVNAP